MHKAKTHLNSLQLSSQAAEQTSVTARGRVMVFALAMVAVCLVFVYCGWWSVVAGIHACLGVVLILVVGWPFVALFCPQPGTLRRCTFGWVRWAVGMSAWVIAVATVFPGGGYRHQCGVHEKTLGLPDPRRGSKHRSGQDVRTPGLPDPEEDAGFWGWMEEL